MTFTKLLLSIGIAILVFWLLGIALNVAKWLIEVALVVGLVFVVISLISRFVARKKKPSA